MATKDKLVSLEVLKATTQADVNDLKSAVNPLTNQNNIFLDPKMTTMSAWPSGSFSAPIGWISTPAATVATGGELTKAFSYANGSATNCNVAQDFLPAMIPAGNYITGFRIKNTSDLTYRVSITGYPTAANSNGTSLYYSSALPIKTSAEYVNYTHSFTLPDTSSYNHIRFNFMLNSVTTASMTEAYILAAGSEYSPVMDDIRENAGEIAEIKSAMAFSEKSITYKSGSSFIYKDGTTQSNSNYFYSDAIAVTKGDIVDYYGLGYLTNVAMISTCNASTESIVPKVISTDSTVKHYYYTVEQTGYVTVSGSKNANYNVTVYGAQSNAALLNALNTKEGFSFASFSMFRTFGVIGDSYSSGVIFPDPTSSEYVTDYALSWGQVLARMAGNTCHNFSFGGAQTSTWLTNTDFGKAAMEAEDPMNLYIICLGINDYQKATYQLGTSADIGTLTESFYGYYSRIVEAVATHAPDAPIILSTMRSGRPTSETYPFSGDDVNAAIIEIAASYGLPCIQPDNDPLFVSGYYLNNMSKGHPVAVMYSAMAQAYKRLIEAAMVDNFTYFSAYTDDGT